YEACDGCRDQGALLSRSSLWEAHRRANRIADGIGLINEAPVPHVDFTPQLCLAQSAELVHYSVAFRRSGNVRTTQQEAKKHGETSSNDKRGGCHDCDDNRP